MTHVDLSQARPLAENADTCFRGLKIDDNCAIPGDLARAWLELPNPHGRPNSDVLKPGCKAHDVTRRHGDEWVIDFADQTSDTEARLYTRPFQHVAEQLGAKQERPGRQAQRDLGWRLTPGDRDLRAALAVLPRYIATPHTATQRLFVWLDAAIVPGGNLLMVARADDASFGILHSRLHEAWALGMASRTGVGNGSHYIPTAFETFPFPAGLSPRDTAIRAGWGSAPCMLGTIAGENIAAAARRLNELREKWLNPPEWVEWVRTSAEEAAGFPPRPVARPGHAGDLEMRTLDHLYGLRPTWLVQAHQALDAAVAAAYGWQDYTPELADEEILRRLLVLNRERAGPG